MLARQGHDVTYIACVFHPFKKVKKWGFCSWNEEKVRIYTFSQFYFPARFHIYMNHFQEKVWGKLLSLCEKERGLPDIIHVHYPTMITQPKTILAYKERGIKIIATEHWTAVQTGQINGHERNQLKAYVSEADQFICVGKPLADSVLELTNTKHKVHIVPNVVPDYFTIKKKDWNGFRFVAVGRLVPVKQFDHLINSFWQVYSGNKDVTLTIVGGGSEYKHLKKLVDRLEANEQIKMTGTLPRGETADIISLSDVLVCYSRLETFGVPVIEAWYCGLPVIASSAIGFAEYFNESLGLLIPYDDDKKLETSLSDVRNEYKKYSKDFIHSYADANFSEATVYKKLMKIYEI